MTIKKGVFISVEGIDGAGKSTHIPFMIDYLTKNDIKVVTQREPGGTPIGESLRQILLHAKNLHEITELLLMFAWIFSYKTFDTFINCDTLIFENFVVENLHHKPLNYFVSKGTHCWEC